MNDYRYHYMFTTFVSNIQACIFTIKHYICHIARVLRNAHVIKLASKVGYVGFVEMEISPGIVEKEGER